MTEKMKSVVHTQPQTDDSTGEAVRPGPTVAVDGGKRHASSYTNRTAPAGTEPSTIAIDERAVEECDDSA